MKDINTLDRQLARWQVLAKLIALPTMFLAAWLTTKGLYDSTIESHAANIEGMITATMTAMVAIVLLGGGTMLLFDLALFSGRTQRWQMSGLAATLMPFVVGISTYNAILATSGERSLILNMQDTTAQWQAYMEGSTDATNAQNAKDSLAPLQASLCALAESERKHGLLSGSGGMGAVSAAYSSACGSVEAILLTLKETSERSQSQQDKAAVLLDALDAIPQNATISVFERQVQYKIQDRALRKLLTEFGAQSIAAQVKAQLGILQNSVASLGTQDGVFGQKQDNAVKNLKESLGLVIKTVDGLLHQDKSKIDPPAPLLAMDEAVFKYLRRNLPRVLIAIATDFFALWLLAFLVVVGNAAQHRRKALFSNAQTNH